MGAEERHWIQNTMPILIEFTTAEDDTWLRAIINGSANRVPQLQRVVVQGTDEATRVVQALANIKIKRHKMYGGATYRRGVEYERT